jgi:16S rRNA (cytidine1402-2'-O)-methyltransferase
MALPDSSDTIKVSKSQLRPGLTLLATPIGNARDVTLRTLDALRDADVLACEDTRMARRLMDMHGIALGSRPLIAYHEHNAAQATPRLLEFIAEGARVVYLSDAGTPIVADPGYRLAKAVIEAGGGLSATPGPCAAIMALTLSGLPSDRFTFGGFSPSRSGQRQTFFREFIGAPGTLIFYESPRRLAASLGDMKTVFGARDAAVARELSKTFEEVRRGLLSELSDHYAEAGAPKGEVVVLIGPAAAAPPTEEALDEALHKALADMSLKDAARSVSEALGLPRKQVYERALALK